MVLSEYLIEYIREMFKRKRKKKRKDKFGYTIDKRDLSNIFKYYGVQEPDEEIELQENTKEDDKHVPVVTRTSLERRKVYNTIIGCLQNNFADKDDVATILTAIKEIDIKENGIDIVYSFSELQCAGLIIPKEAIKKALAFSADNQMLNVMFIEDGRPSILEYYSEIYN